MAKSRGRRSKKHNIVSTNKVVIPKAANSILLNRASDIVSAETEVNGSSSQESGFSTEVLEFRRSQSLAENAGEVSVSLEHPSTIGALDPLPLEDKVMLRNSFQKSL